MGYEKSEWWFFIHHCSKSLLSWLSDFREGLHVFEPMKQIPFKDESMRLWSYQDRLILHLIGRILKSTFQYVISPRCLHLKGPSIIRKATREIKAALSTQEFHYFCRLDIKSYYASIDHNILINQLHRHCDDPILLKYLEAIITTGVDVNGQVLLPKQGLPLRSSLSPFFGALYLSELDRVFENKNDLFYYHYMDDIIILTKTKRQFRKVRKIVFKILQNLKLRLSDRKTRMGSLLKNEFHYLGIKYEVTRTPPISSASKAEQTKNQVTVTVHERICRRALDKVKVLRKNAVHPAKIQRNRVRWATWRHHSGKLTPFKSLEQWVEVARFIRDRLPGLVRVF